MFLYFIQGLFFYLYRGHFPSNLINFNFKSYIWSINSILIMWLLLSIRYQIKSFTLKNTTTLNYEILFKKIWIYKQEMMVEIILFNQIKTPVGASGAFNEWVIESVKRQIHQMFMHGIMKLWLNRFVQNTESFSNESDGCFEMRCGSAKNVSDLILLYLLI